MTDLPAIPFWDEIRHISVAPTSEQTRFGINNLMALFGLPPLPDWWDYRWNVEKDDSGRGYSGNFSKRVRKWALVEHNHKLTDKVISDLGERVRYNLPKEYSLFLDFTRKLSWNPGDFKEEYGSCWWTDRGAARQLLVEADGFAMRHRFSLDPESKTGLGRCWVATTPEAYVVFNAYGREFSREDYAAILAAMLGLSYKNHVKITNLKRPTGLVYANGSSGSLVGHKETLMHFDTIDLGIDVSEYAPICNYCGMDLWMITAHQHGQYIRCEDCNNRNVTKLLLPYPQERVPV